MVLERKGVRIGLLQRTSFYWGTGAENHQYMSEIVQATFRLLWASNNANPRRNFRATLMGGGIRRAFASVLAGRHPAGVAHELRIAGGHRAFSY